MLCARVLHMKTEAYAQQKICNGIAGETTLAEMPQLKVSVVVRIGVRMHPLRLSLSQCPPIFLTFVNDLDVESYLT